MQFDDDGTLAQLRHRGWEIDFNRWSLHQDQLLLPSRIEARDTPYRVRAALSDWQFESASQALSVSGRGNPLLAPHSVQ